MPEIAFYHLTRATVEQTLPTLLERTLARGWRAVVQAASEARLRQLDADLWSYRPESFLPHGAKADGAPQAQLIYLTCEDDNPNGADVRFFVEGARIAPALAGSGARNGKNCATWAIASSITSKARAADGKRRRANRNHRK
jgi:DNA polymerase-3 subunit chi